MNVTKQFLFQVGILLGLIPVLGIAKSDRVAFNESRRDSALETSGANPNTSSPDVDFRMDARDKALARQVREAFVEDEGLSVYGKNVAILVDRGTITLRGSVPNEQERSRVEKRAKEAASGKRVVNDIEVMAE